MIDDERDLIELAEYLVGGKSYYTAENRTNLDYKRAEIFVLLDISESLRKITNLLESGKTIES